MHPKPASISKGVRVRQAVATLFEGFKRSDRRETEWARRLLQLPSATDGEIRAEILVAMNCFCPNVPPEFVPFVVELLTAGIRLARQDAGIDLLCIRPKTQTDAEDCGEPPMMSFAAASSESPSAAKTSTIR